MENRGTCRSCGRDMRLKKDGTLRQHGDGNGGYWCSGAGLDPIGKSRQERKED